MSKDKCYGGKDRADGGCQVATGSFKSVVGQGRGLRRSLSKDLKAGKEQAMQVSREEHSRQKKQQVQQPEAKHGYGP